MRILGQGSGVSTFIRPACPSPRGKRNRSPGCRLLTLCLGTEARAQARVSFFSKPLLTPLTVFLARAREGVRGCVALRPSSS